MNQRIAMVHPGKGQKARTAQDPLAHAPLRSAVDSPTDLLYVIDYKVFLVQYRHRLAPHTTRLGALAPCRQPRLGLALLAMISTAIWVILLRVLRACLRRFSNASSALIPWRSISTPIATLMSRF